MGKLLVRKSGKVQLVLGKVTLDVTMGTPCSFLQVLGGRRDGICGAAPKGAPRGRHLSIPTPYNGEKELSPGPFFHPNPEEGFWPPR